MYEQVEKPKENKSRAVANSVAQNKSNVKQGFGFVDNRHRSVSKGNVPTDSILNARNSIFQAMKMEASNPIQFKLPQDSELRKLTWQGIKAKFGKGREHITKFRDWENILKHITSEEFSGVDEKDVGIYIDQKHLAPIPIEKPPQDIEVKSKVQPPTEEQKKQEVLMGSESSIDAQYGQSSEHKVFSGLKNETKFWQKTQSEQFEEEKMEEVVDEQKQGKMEPKVENQIDMVLEGQLGDGSHHTAYSIQGNAKQILLVTSNPEKSLSERMKSYSQFPDATFVPASSELSIKEGIYQNKVVRGILMNKMEGTAFHSTRQGWAGPGSLSKVVKGWLDKDKEAAQEKIKILIEGIKEFLSHKKVVHDFQYWVIENTGEFKMTDVKSATHDPDEKGQPELRNSLIQLEKLVDS
ncbi:MAG: hypothetical protein JKY48_00570 [Flavobacteriales bacterium]|nr:hypothetical protein [Flavobacteriales bacterium]